MKKLEQGNSNEVWRDGDTVLRKRRKWSPLVHKFLIHLHQSGFIEAPKFIEVKGKYERLSYLDGEVGHYPLHSYMLTNHVVIDAAKLLRKLHDVSESFKLPSDAVFMLPNISVTDYEIIGHNDFAPYNCVFKDKKLRGIIDFDTIAPTTRVWDIAYAVYRFCPLATDQHCSDMGFQKMPHRHYRLKLFCDAYGLDKRDQLIPTVIKRLEALIDYMQSTSSNLEHIEVYQKDIQYIKANHVELSNGL